MRDSFLDREIDGIKHRDRLSAGLILSPLFILLLVLFIVVVVVDTAVPDTEFGPITVNTNGPLVCVRSLRPDAMQCWMLEVDTAGETSFDTEDDITYAQEERDERTQAP